MKTHLHEKMTKEMVNLLPSGFIDFFRSEVNGDTAIDIIAVGSYIEDTTNGPLSKNPGDDILPFLEHFWRQNLGTKGLSFKNSRPAYKRAQDYWNKYISYKKWYVMSSYEKERALLYLGRIIHLFQDMGTPAHANNDMHADIFGGNDSYEDYTGSKSEKTLPEEFGIQDDTKIYFDEKGGSIKEYFRLLAKETIKYDSDDVNGLEEGLPYRHDRESVFYDDLSDWSCQLIGKNLLPKTHTFTAGLLVKFCKEIEVFKNINDLNDDFLYDVTILIKGITVTNDQDSVYGNYGDGIIRITNGGEKKKIDLGSGSLNGGEHKHLAIECKRKNLKLGEVATFSIEVQDKDIGGLVELIGQAELIIDPNDFKLNKPTITNFSNNDIDLDYIVTMSRHTNTSVKKYALTTYLDKIYVKNDTDPAGSGELYGIHYIDGPKKTISIGDISSGQSKSFKKRLGAFSRPLLNGENINLALEVKDDDYGHNDSLGQASITITPNEWEQYINKEEGYTTEYLLSERPNYCKVKFKILIKDRDMRGTIGNRIEDYLWKSGWSSVEFYKIASQTYLFLLKESSGKVHIHKMNSDGSVGDSVEEHSWKSGWSKAEFYEVAGQTYLFLLKQSNGKVHIHKMNYDGSVGDSVEKHSWKSGWSNVEFYEISGQTYLFLLKQSNGKVHIHKINSDGSVGNSIEEHSWKSGWSSTEFYEISGQTYLFLLKNKNGTVHIHKMNSDGSVGDSVKNYSWKSGWSSVKFYEIAGQTYLFLLKQLSGEVHIHRINIDGSIDEQISEEKWSTGSFNWNGIPFSGWSNVEFYHINGQTYLFLLQKIGGQVHIHKVYKTKLGETSFSELRKQLQNSKEVLKELKQFKASDNEDNLYYYNVGSKVLHHNSCSKLKKENLKVVRASFKDVMKLKRIKNKKLLHPGYQIKELEEKLKTLTEKTSLLYAPILAKRLKKSKISIKNYRVIEQIVKKTVSKTKLSKPSRLKSKKSVNVKNKEINRLLNIKDLKELSSNLKKNKKLTNYVLNIIRKQILLISIKKALINKKIIKLKKNSNIQNFDSYNMRLRLSKSIICSQCQ